MPEPRADAPARQVVLLGASNLALGFPLLTRVLQSGFAGPLHVFGAFGHGRSYGTWSTVLHRSLPGISTCGLWDALKEDSPAAAGRAALITDVGNDLLYGASVPQIAGWVESCLERLNGSGADLTMTLLPMASVERLSALRYNCARTLFFPRCGLTRPIVLERALALNEHLQELGRACGARLIEPPGAWYGFDPIHIRVTRRLAAWRHVFAAWPGFRESARLEAPSLPTYCRLRLLRPAHRRVFGRDQITPQPVLRTERLTVSLF